jgi:hypothetical protein
VEIDRARGLKRLAVALAAAWVLLWGYRLIADYHSIQKATAAQKAIKGLSSSSPYEDAWLKAAIGSFQHDITIFGISTVILVLGCWAMMGFMPRR